MCPWERTQREKMIMWTETHLGREWFQPLIGHPSLGIYTGKMSPLGWLEKHWN